MRSNSGFILLEIIISIALGALILGALWGNFFQVNNTYKIVNRIINIDSKACVIQHQFERDISGAFIPFIFEKSEKDKKVEKKEKPVAKSFYSRNQEKNIQFLTFVTSNPLQVYGNQKPRVSRVVYFLVSERGIKQKKSYKLLRKELKGLSFKEPKERSFKGQEVVSGIRSMSIEYTVRPIKKTNEKNVQVNKDDDKNKKLDYEKFNVWGEEQIKKVGKNIPDFITITILFWDKLRKKSQQFVFRSDIIVKDFLSDKETPQQDKKEEIQKPKVEKNNQKPGIGFKLRLKNK